ncbi:MAG TPA: PP2C family serine/threonine-protein phosphatase [Pseudonocardia sp.]|jgi:serine/threonine protein phosphatase PrpC|uniref:PP2C family protein-serine/threonine phosphatase n=1 Tax=Pseudonocardia sp. TaxID=60912 RepID=UPI002BB87990|nr:PP2C family serine/threonine-protein phosphatase [Pseudonocardia sp.]HTF46072.1 PP2C family serine/threonine-protein phosphatase [Pseudonocardia sp.]
MTLVLRYSARSDRGLVRQNNQDSVYAGPRLLALADGMGGHAAGEVASKLVISALVPLDDDEPSDDLLGELREATEHGNEAITNLVAEQPDLEGMGTTLTAILFAGNRLGLVHIGDSRAYLMRDGQLNQITKDDTFVQSLIDEGRIKPEEAHTHPQRSLLLRALTGHELEPSLAVREARAGDRYLLCSDGLSSVVSEETLAETMRTPDPKVTADRMIELALRGGGPDNITCIVADVVDIDFGEDAPIVGGAAGDGTEQPQPDSAAARASVTTLPRVAPQRIEPTTMELPVVRRKGRAGLILLAALVVLIGAGALARLWVLQQYYVGVNDDQVAIYQGVRGSVLGIPLQNLREGSCPAGSEGCTEIKLEDLQETARSAVRDGIISGNGLTDARATVDRLRRQMLPPCPAAPPAIPVQAAPNQTSATNPGGPAAGGSKPTDQNVPPAPGSRPNAGAAAPTPVPETTPLPSIQYEPGKNCRLVS